MPLFSRTSSRKTIIRFSSNVSLMPEPNNPGRPFMASFQPGLLPSISTPMPYGSSVANLFSVRDSIFTNRLVR
ncbi:hypothetical protein D3C79_961990 [compost metagenome]